MTRRDAPPARTTGPSPTADARPPTDERSGELPTVRISSSTTGTGRPVAPAPTASAVRSSRRGRAGGGGGPGAPSGPDRNDPTRGAARTRPAARPGGGDDPEAPPTHRGHRPSRLVLLVAATVTVVVAALFFVPRVREDDGPADRTVDRYTVTLGDTISSVAQLHGTSKEAIQEANGLTDRSSIEPGSQIEIPHPTSDDSELPTFLAAEPSLVALRPTFAAMATEYDVPVALLESLAWQVSAWDEDDVGEEGRVGIAQLRPSTVDYINDELVAGPTLDPEVAAGSIELMAAYVDELLTETDGSWAATVAAYSLGLNASRTSSWDGDTIGFVTTVLAGVPDFEAG